MCGGGGWGGGGVEVRGGEGNAGAEYLSLDDVGLGILEVCLYVYFRQQP